jgi:hypothetical protein
LAIIERSVNIRHVVLADSQKGQAQFVREITKIALLFILTLASAFAGPISSLTPTEVELVATGGEVFVYFAGSTAGNDSVLNLISPTTVGPFFPNHSTPAGTELSLGTFNAGDVLRFRLDNLTSGFSYFTGPAAGNPDGVIHVAHAGWAADGLIPYDGVLVGFEDLYGGGDLDYDDNTFVFRNVSSSVITPEPASFVLACAGLAAVLIARRRR